MSALTGITPALDAWNRRGDTKLLDDLWAAACWEAAALETPNPERRRACFARARALYTTEVRGQ